MAIRIGATALILNKKGDILLTKRHDLRIWVFPGGGAHGTESLEQTAEREVEEETGIKIKIKRLVGIYVRDHPLSRRIGFFFLAQEAGGKRKSQPGEVLDTRWVKKQDVKKYLGPNYYQRFQDAFAKNKKVKARVDHSSPITFSQIPSFLWRRKLGKWLKLVRL